MDRKIDQIKDLLKDVKHNLAYLLDADLNENDFYQALDHSNMLLNEADEKLEYIKNLSTLIATTLKSE